MNNHLHPLFAHILNNAGHLAEPARPAPKSTFTSRRCWACGGSGWIESSMDGMLGSGSNCTNCAGTGNVVVETPAAE